MHIVSMTIPRQQVLPSRRPSPLVSVLTWELRRYSTNRLFWLQALSFFALMLFVLWFGRELNTFTLNTLSGFTAGTSAWGLTTLLPLGLLLLGLLLPFVNADGVTHDLHRRTHDLVMTTPLPGWAYVWGRYLVGLLMSLGLAVLLLAAILGMGVIFHLTIPNYPAPDLGTVLTLWGGMVVPATLLLSSVSFALGTLIPRQSMLMKISILLAWVCGSTLLRSVVLSGPTRPPAWYIAWDPTSAVTARVLFDQYSTAFQNQATNFTSAAQMQHLLLSVENQVSDPRTWMEPHLILAGLSLLLVALTASRFQQFRDTIGG